MYGSGEDPDLVGTQPPQTHGQGSQIGSHDITGKNPPSAATDPAVSSDYGTGEGRHLGTSGPPGLTEGEDHYLSPGPRGVADEMSTTASILSGVPGKDQSSSSTRPSGTDDALDINKPLPREPTGTGFTNSDSSSATPHTSNLAEEVNPRVDPGPDRSRGIGHDNATGSGLTGNTIPDRTVERYVGRLQATIEADSSQSSEYDTHPQPTDSSLGRDAALGAGVGAGVGAGTAAVLHHKRDQDDLRSASGRSFPSAGNSDTSAPGSALPGITGTTAAGPHSSSLANKADPRVDSDLDGSGTIGPHSSGLANKADPRVDSDLDGSGTARSAGYASGTGPTAGATSQGLSGRDAHTGAGGETGVLPVSQTSATGLGSESRKNQHVPHGHHFAGDPCHDNAVEGRPLFTKGPHVTDTANLLDPHVTPEFKSPSEPTAISSDREPGFNAPGGDSHGRVVPELGSNVYGGDRQRGEAPELGPTTQSGPHHGRETAVSESVSQGDTHHGRDAALVGGLGAAGAAAAYSSSRDDTPAAEHTSSTTGPHHSKVMNKLDPRVDPTSTSSEGPASTKETSALIGSSVPGSSSHMPTSKEVGAGYDHGRDTSVGAGFAGAAGAASAAGVAGYESEKHPGNFEPTVAKTSTAGIGPSDPVGTNTTGDYGRDVTPEVTGGSGIDEESYPREEKHRGLTSRLPGFLGGHKKSKEPTGSGENETTVPPSATDPVGTEPESGSGHHYVRDAGLASAGIGGGLAAYETQKIHTRDEPVTASAEPSTYPQSGYEDGGRIADTHAGRDAAPASGVVGTGLGTDDGAELSKRESEKQAEAREKEFEKEQKAIHKEQVKHEKALEKEEKKHEKEERKQEKALEKEEKRLQKEEKKHEKELAKEEKQQQQNDDGKKHGGILGLFHRDKTDKADETDIRDQYPDGSYQESDVSTGAPGVGAAGAAGVGAADAGAADAGAGTAVEHEKHKHVPNKLHKDPPAGYYESKGYQPPTTGDGSQPSDGAGTTAPIHGNEYSTGYQRSSTGDVYPK